MSRPPAEKRAPETGAHARPGELHRRIGMAALERQYISLDVLSQALLEVGNQPASSPFAVWVQSGRLDRTELAELLHQIQPDEQYSTGPIEAVLRDTGAARSVEAPHTGQLAPVPDGADDPTASLTFADVLETYGFDRPLLAVGNDQAPTLPPQPEGQPPANSASRNDEADEDTPRPIARPTPSAANNRYLLGAELGRGAVGRVVKSFDRFLGRNVAMKLPLAWPMAREHVEQFIEEAQATGQLEHPNIVPIYDVGQLPGGELYYTMKRVRDRSLKDALDALRTADEETLEEYGQTRLLSIFLKVALAVHYAHARGVIHRDLKPENIMLGEYGEVHVMDWGLARVLQRGVVTERGLRNRDEQMTRGGQTVGTPAYMPPEQAQGRLAQVDERSDVYSLGVILYEMLTLKQPSTRSTVMETLMAVITDPIPPPRRAAPNRDIPEDLERIVMRALEKEPQKRWKSAKALHDAVEKFLDGRNEREAQRHLYEGERHFRLYEQARDEMVRLDEAVQEVAARIEDWEPAEHKRSLWQLEDLRTDAASRMVRKFGDALREFTQSLAYLPRYEPALHAVSRLIWSRYRVAERDNNPLDLIIYENLLRQYDDGTWLARIDDASPVSIDIADGSKAEVFIAPYVEHDRVLRPGPPERIGRAPVRRFGVHRGSYALRVKAPGRPSVNVPLHILRSDPVNLSIDLPPRDAWPRDFAFVPGGHTILGGDPEAFDPLPWQILQVDSFFIQRYPVTFGEYIAFLDDLARTDPELADLRSPRTRDADGHLVIHTEDGRFAPNPVLIEGPLRELYPAGEGFELQLPVLAIRYEDAMAFAHWRGQQDGFAYTLPTEAQFERAARGADGRRYPWGNTFDATFCKMNVSRSMPSQPEPVGSFPIDRSIFDVYDLSGNVREFALIEDAAENEVVTRGGAWNSDARTCRSASRTRLLRDARTATVGFRLALPWTPGR